MVQDVRVGEYIFMPVLDNRIKDGPQNNLMKQNFTRSQSVLQIEDIIMASNLASRIYGIKKDGKITAEEVEFVQKLKEEGLSDEKIRRIVDFIVIAAELKIQGLRDTHIKAILDSVETVAEQINELKNNKLSEQEIKSTMEKVWAGEMEFKDAIKQKDDDMFPERGKIREGPWDH